MVLQGLESSITGSTGIARYIDWMHMIGGYWPRNTWALYRLNLPFDPFAIWILVVALTTQIRHHITPPAVRCDHTRALNSKIKFWKKHRPPSPKKTAQSSMEIDLKTKAARTAASTFKMLTNLREVWKPRSTCPSVIFPQSKAEVFSPRSYKI